MIVLQVLCKPMELVPMDMFNALWTLQYRVLWISFISVAILHSCQYLKIIHFNCITTLCNWVVKIRKSSEAVIRL